MKKVNMGTIRTTIVLIGLLSILSTQEALAISDWYKDKHRGWYWYEENAKEENEAKNKFDNKPEIRTEKKLKNDPKDDDKLFAPPKSKEEASAQISKIQEVMKEARSYAILTQKPEDTARYVGLQKRVLDIAEKFGASWQEALRQNPDLDENITHPVLGQAKEINEKITLETENNQIAEFSKSFGLVLVSRESCPYCHAFLPILREFADKYQFKLIAMTNDGSRMDAASLNGIAQINNPELLTSLKAEYVPALYAINTDSGEGIIVSSGLISLEDLRKRVLMAIKANDEKKGSEHYVSGD